MKGRRHH